MGQWRKVQDMTTATVIRVNGNQQCLKLDELKEHFVQIQKLNMENL